MTSEGSSLALLFQLFKNLDESFKNLVHDLSGCPLGLTDEMRNEVGFHSLKVPLKNIDASSSNIFPR